MVIQDNDCLVNSSFPGVADFNGQDVRQAEPENQVENEELQTKESMNHNESSGGEEKKKCDGDDEKEEEEKEKSPEQTVPTIVVNNEDGRDVKEEAKKVTPGRNHPNAALNNKSPTSPLAMSEANETESRRSVTPNPSNASDDDDEDDQPLSKAVKKEPQEPTPRRSTRKRESLVTPPPSVETKTYQGRLRRSTVSPASTMADLTTPPPSLDAVKTERSDDERVELNKTPTSRKRRGADHLLVKEMKQNEEEIVAKESEQETKTKKHRRAAAQNALKRCEACGVEASLTALRYGSGRFCSKTCVGLFANKHRHRGRKNGNGEGEEETESTNKKRILRDGKRTRSSQPELQIENSNDSNDSSSDSSSNSTISFSWSEYLKSTNATAVPESFFLNVCNFLSLILQKLITFYFFQALPNFNPSSFFEVGHRLEGIDPKHPSLFCVLSVVQVVGYRLRLHYDGFSSSHDFWTNADSPYIFPVGWTEKSGRKLQMPKGWKRSRFTWPAYLRSTNSTAAPQELFTSLKLPQPHPGLKKGMKLEAVDKTNTLLTCVASLADFFGDRLLIHFDGWGDLYDFWTDASSPYLHVVGWCQDMGRALSPPNDYPDIENFTWEDYLSITGSESIPSDLFKSRPPISFMVGQKMEAVDRRIPSILRIATVVETVDYRVKIRYDGCSENLDIYIDDDCADIHPCGWSSHTSHPLQLPNQHEDGGQNQLNGATPIKSSQFSACGCQYSTPGVPERTPRSNNERLVGTETFVENNGLLQKAEKPNGAKLDSKPKNGKNGRTISSNGKRNVNTRKGDDSHKNHHHNPNRSAKAAEMINSVRRFIFNVQLRNSKQQEQQLKNDCNGSLSSSLVMDRLLEAINPDLALFNKVEPENGNGENGEVTNGSKKLTRRSESSSGNDEVSSSSSDDVKANIKGITLSHVAAWNVQNVVEFVRSLPGCQQNSQAFADEQIDGTALLLLNQADMLKIMNMKLGPVLKIFSVIQAIKKA